MSVHKAELTLAGDASQLLALYHYSAHKDNRQPSCSVLSYIIANWVEEKRWTLQRWVKLRHQRRTLALHGSALRPSCGSMWALSHLPTPMVRQRRIASTMDRCKIMMWSAARFQPQTALQVLDVEKYWMIMHSEHVLTCTEALDIEVSSSTDCTHTVVAAFESHFVSW